MGKVVILLVGMGISSVFAASVDLGPSLAVITKIQGAWKSNCAPVGDTASKGYRVDYLNISFTYFDFVAHVYSDEQCKAEVSRWPAKYRFVVGEPLQLSSGDNVFELNLEELEDPANAWLLSPANILKIEAGQLYLGRENSFGTPSSSRIEKLNSSAFFRR